MAEHIILAENYIAPETKRFIVHAPVIAKKGKPGQFVIIRVSDRGERIPLTIVDSDVDAGTITLIVQGIGKSTRDINQLEVGDNIQDLVGPLGNPSPIDYFGHVVVIGGGVGTAVSFPQAKALKAAGNRVTAIIGARTMNLVILEDELAEFADKVLVCTDDGSYGRNGFVTDELNTLLDSGEQIDYVLTVGPLAMMRAVAEMTRPYGIKTVASLNSIMVDGTGMCGGCRVSVGDTTKFACVDGPDFDAHLVDFDSLMKRNLAYIHEEQCALEEAAQEIEQANRREIRKIPRQPMPAREPEERVKDFIEVNLGFTETLALLEAQRCLECKNQPCVEGCPVGVKIPDFIRLIKERDYIASSKKYKENNVLAAVCGRVCPQSDQCEGACILTKRGEAVAIGALVRFVTDYERVHGNLTPEPFPFQQKTGKKVAIIGSGPAGLACAGDLIRMGHAVTVFEAYHEYGGVLTYGIPEFRLPKAIVREEVEGLAALGVEFKPNIVIGVTYTIDELMEEEGYQAVFVGVGAGLPYFMNIPGENLVGVYSANEFLTRVNLMKAYEFPKSDTPVIDCLGKRVAVIGGGNTALDSARVALRLGASQSSIIYRRTDKEMPARLEEIKHAKDEHIDFQFLQAPVEYIGDEGGWLKAMRLIRMELGEPDQSGRRSPVPIEGSEYEVPVNLVIVAIGNGSNPIIQRTTHDLNFNRWGNIIVDEETMATSKPGVFAGGDIVTGGATVILAMGAGRKAAHSIDAYLQSSDGSK
ncbi:MAG TPA: NADPH-dependent glutamate synthase [Brevefilum sp.]|nr:NADPH-dependent glutamate synthase [Brevefilum sp.]HOR19104.1 NADPH-dependent glutamate synthase [Brevefilum sp.]HPL68908.1 NADPH-dependent glutamate synthase [Brevefilum sp.]